MDARDYCPKKFVSFTDDALDILSCKYDYYEDSYYEA